jgi:hypothetical protein
MNTGMLWFDNDPKTALTAKIERATDYYHKKYGRKPNLCLIHPSMLPADEKVGNDNPTTGKTVWSGAEGVVIRPYRPVLPGHLWIGIEEKN